ncbi:MAG: MerR family transcriptional regulator [Nitriliruptorales bacterium]|nr:MerR family transcriptional regulator [Nitriliruptorales bacterium]
MDNGRLRIGEFSERVGVTPDLLRAWERRYGLLQPERSSGGFRLYTREDIERVERMRELLDGGLSAAEAARQAIEEQQSPAQPIGVPARPADPDVLEQSAEQLVSALERFNEPAAQEIIDTLVATWGIEVVMRDVLMPVMVRIGERWEEGTLTVGQEHFAAGLVRGRLLSLARGWGQGIGPRAILATPPGEDHDLGLVAFGLALWRRGWSISLLGANTPADAIVAAVEQLTPDALVLSAVKRERLLAIEAAIAEVGRRVPVAIGGHGADDHVAETLGAIHLAGDVVTAAQQLSDLHASR